jgi:hypothetical protein
LSTSSEASANAPGTRNPQRITAPLAPCIDHAVDGDRQRRAFVGMTKIQQVAAAHESAPNKIAPSVACP